MFVEFLGGSHTRPHEKFGGFNSTSGQDYLLGSTHCGHSTVLRWIKRGYKGSTGLMRQGVGFEKVMGKRRMFGKVMEERVVD